MNKQIFIGINNETELVSVELDYNDLNKGTKWYNPHHSVRPHYYREIVDSERGEEAAHDRLADEEYWRDIGFISKDTPAVIINNVDWEAVADEVISSDGWENTNGEWYEIGEYDGKDYFISLGGCGQEYKRSDFKKIFISEEDFKYLLSKKEWKKSEKKEVKKLLALFDKEQKMEPIIEAFLEVGEYTEN